YVLSEGQREPLPEDVDAFVRRLRGREVRAHAARLRGAAASVDRFRQRVLVGVACIAGVGVAASGAWWACPVAHWLPLPESLELAAAIGLLVVTPAVVALGGGLSLSMAAGYRRLLRKRFRRQLADLPRARIAQVLGALNEERIAETRSLRDEL